jgi:hypothetical protein
MQTIKTLVKASDPGYNAPVGGRMLLIQSCDAGNVLAVTLTDAAGNQYAVSGVGAGFKAKPMAGFSTVAITATEDANVQFIVSQGDVDLQLSQVNAVIANSPTAPANVQIQGQGTTSGNPLYVNAQGVTLNATNVGINNTSANPVPVSMVSEPGAPFAVSGTVNIGNAVGAPVPVQPVQAATVTDSAPVAVAAYTSATPNQVNIIAAGARRMLRIRNPIASTSNLYLGSSTVTPSNAAVVLQPGDMWIETDVPQVAWYATSDAGGAGATANIQVIA